LNFTKKKIENYLQLEKQKRSEQLNRESFESRKRERRMTNEIKLDKTMKNRS